MERFESQKYSSEITTLNNRIKEENVDETDSEAVRRVAEDLFGHGHTEHQIEEIVEAFFDDQTNNIEN